MENEERKKRTVEIFEEDNSIIIDDWFDTTDFSFYPEKKTFTVSQSIKDDCFYNNQTIEYKISVNPIELYMRTLESSHEPPLEYSIKDGVVLESELMKKKWLRENTIKDLKKEVEWQKSELFVNYEINLYILSKHPEIISKEEYRRFLRQSIERLNLGVMRVENAVRDDKKELKIVISNDDEKSIWFKVDVLEKAESDSYWELSEEDKIKSEYGKKIKYAEDFNDSVFIETSKKYTGISKYEFQISTKLIKYIESLLEEKDITRIQENKSLNTESQIGDTKIYGYFVIGLTILFIGLKLTDSVDWNWFAVLSPYLIWEGLGFITGFLNGLSK